MLKGRKRMSAHFKNEHGKGKKGGYDKGALIGCGVVGMTDARV